MRYLIVLVPLAVYWGVLALQPHDRVVTSSRHDVAWFALLAAISACVVLL